MGPSVLEKKILGILSICECTCGLCDPNFMIHVNSVSYLHLATLKSQAAKVSKISIFFTFSNVKAYVSKIDLAVKYVKVIPGSSFDPIVIGWSHQCYIPSFMEIGPLVLEKKIFERFQSYKGLVAIWSWYEDIAQKKKKKKKKKKSMPLSKKAPHQISTGSAKTFQR